MKLRGGTPDLLGERAIGLGALAIGIVGEDGLTHRLRFREANCVGDHGLEHLDVILKLGPRILNNLSADGGTGSLCDKDARDAQVRVQPGFAYLRDVLKHHRDALSRKVLRLHRDTDLIGGDKRIRDKDAQVGQGINQDVIIGRCQRGEQLFEDKLTIVSAVRKTVSALLRRTSVGLRSTLMLV